MLNVKTLVHLVGATVVREAFNRDSKQSDSKLLTIDGVAGNLIALPQNRWRIGNLPGEVFQFFRPGVSQKLHRAGNHRFEETERASTFQMG